MNPGLLEPYEKAGDLFYDFGTHDRGVREWKNALSLTGGDRQRVARKLADHYMRFGKEQLELASLPTEAEKALPKALEAFTQCLEYDRSSKEAGDLLGQTRAEIAEREERRDLAIRTLASAEKVLKEADQSASEEAYGNAIDTYTKAGHLFEIIDEEFSEQFKAAQSGKEQARKQILGIIEKLIDKAQTAIDDGDRAVEENRFDDAQNLYENVPSIVSVIPGDESTTHGKERKKMTDTAAEKKEQARVRKLRYEQEQRERQQQQPQGK